MDNKNENTPGKGRGLSARIASVFAALSVMLGLGVAFAGPASAAVPSVDPTLPADPSGGAVGSTWTAIQGWVLGSGAAMLFGLTGLGILIRLALKYMKRGARAV